jgi:hypothetical protein
MTRNASAVLVGLTVAWGAGCSDPATLVDSGADAGQGTLVPLPDANLIIAINCTDGGQCPSGICGSNSLCCDTACNAGDRVCGTTACDIHGACLYPDPTTPCGGACSGGALTPSLCDGQGACVPQAAQPCPPPYGCAIGGTACATSCFDDSNCASSAYCNANGQCVARAKTGFCVSNDACLSGICDIHGSGACCLSACDTLDAVCGATACDPTSGACVYPPAGVGCGLSHCTGNDLFRGGCDSLGTCGPPTSKPCAGSFVCLADSSGCERSCLTRSDCVSSHFCDLGGQSIGTATGACCPDYPNMTVQVDNERGSDGPCCGEGPGAQACATIARAMGIVRSTQLYGATIQAAAKQTVDENGNCTFWGDQDAGSVAREYYPIQLGYGVTLLAPGVCFEPYHTNSHFTSNGSCNGPFAAFIVSPFPEEDGGVPGDAGPGPTSSPVTLRGSPAAALVIVTQPALPAITVGPIYDQFTTFTPLTTFLPCGGSVGTNDDSAFIDPTSLLPATAILDTVQISTGSGQIAGPPSTEPNAGPAVFVGPSSSLTLGPGPVSISLTYDVTPGLGSTESLDGIDCIGAPGEWSSLQDISDAGGPVLAISPTNQPQSNNVIGSNVLGTELSVTHCNTNLLAGPQIGSSNCVFDSYGIGIGFNGGAPNYFLWANTFGICEGEQDATFVYGSDAMPGVIHCMAHDGLIIPYQLDCDGNPMSGGPLVQIPGASIRYNDGAGVHIQAGTLETSGANTAIVANDVGIEVDGQCDSTGYCPISMGDEQVTLGTGTVVACNGSLKIIPPGNLSIYPSIMYSYTAPGNKSPFNAGADIWNQNVGGPNVDARGLAWTDYDTTGDTTAVATCDPTCFQPVVPPDYPQTIGACVGCKCAGPGCPSKKFTAIPDGLDVVLATGSSVLVDGGSSLDPNYCSDLAQGPL